MIELMITIAIIGILAAVAVPQYGNYTKRSKFSEVVVKTAGFKTSVSLCVQETNGLATCNPGTGAAANSNIPPNITAPEGYVESINTALGVITAVGIAEVGGHDYVLTPTWNAANDSLTWAITGSCVANRYCPQ